MSYLYFDDSKHSNCNFFLGAFVYSDIDLDNIIADYIKSSGLDPNIDEFKSRLRKDKHPEQVELRNHLKELISQSKIGIVISPPNEKEFKIATCNALFQILENNKKELSYPLEIYLDQGLFKNSNDTEYKSLLDKIGYDSVNLNIEQDSIAIKGIQLADLVAHTCSIMLKESLGVINKTIKAGENSGYDPDTDIEIGFEMWAGVRYNFFSTPPPHPDEWDSMLDCVAKVGDKGLFISNECSDFVKEKAKSRFQEMYLGCIH